MSIDSPSGVFLTPERLRGIVKIMTTLATQNGTEWYFGPEPLQQRLVDYLVEHDYAEAAPKVPEVIAILVWCHVLDPGKRGPKQPNYRRGFHPDVAETTLTWQNIKSYYELRSPRPQRRRREA